MTNWREHLTPAEADTLAEMDKLKRELTEERAALHNRAKQRRHRKAGDAA